MLFLQRERDVGAGAIWLGLAQGDWNSALRGGHPDSEASDCDDPEAASDFFVRGDFADFDSAPKDPELAPGEFGEGAVSEPMAVLGDFVDLQ